MIFIYYYHIPKTGGQTITNFFNEIEKQNPNAVKHYIFNEWKNIPNKPLEIDFNNIFSDSNIKNYKYVIINHHHGFKSLLYYKKLLEIKKNELKKNGHKLFIFTTYRDVISSSNSLINYMFDKKDSNGISNMFTKQNFLNLERFYNLQLKYFNTNIYDHHKSLSNYNNKINNILSLVDLFVKTDDLSIFINKFIFLLKNDDIICKSIKNKNVNKNKQIFFTESENNILEQVNSIEHSFYNLLINHNKNFTSSKNLQDLLHTQ